jgi:hypothetical protein
MYSTRRNLNRQCAVAVDSRRRGGLSAHRIKGLRVSGVLGYALASSHFLDFAVL